MVLKQVYSTKYLDVHLDQHLTWQAHVNYVLSRVRWKLFAINLPLRFYSFYGKWSLAYRGTTIWNRLPPALYSAKTVIVLKIVLYVVIYFVFVYVSYLYCIVFLRA